MSSPEQVAWSGGRIAKAFGGACAAALVMLLLDWPQFFYAQVSASIVPWNWLMITFALVTVSAIPVCAREPRLLMVAASALVYLAINALAVGASADAAASEQELVTRVLGIGVLLSGVVLSAVARRTIGLSGWLVLASVAASTVLLYDLVSGTRWSATFGRAAGTYTNPNVAAGMVLLLGLAAVRRLNREWRELYWLAVCVSSIAAFSRAGYLLVVLASVHLARSGGIRWQRAARIAVFAIASGVALGPTVASLVIERNGNAALAGQIGLSTFLRIEEGDASSTSERLQVAEAAAEVFRTHPFTGAGLTATTRWALPVSTHNQFLRTAAELGLMGLAALVLLLTSVFVSSGTWDRPTALDFGVWLAIALMFSHNVLDNWSMLAAIGAFAGGALGEDKQQINQGMATR